MVVVVKATLYNHDHHEGSDAEHQADIFLAEILRKAGYDCEVVAEELTADSVVIINLPGEYPKQILQQRKLQHETLDGPHSTKAIHNLEVALLRKTREAQELDHNLKVALKSIKTFHRQQNELFDEFVALRDKYDTHKTKLRQVLWDFIPSQLKGFENIPQIDHEVNESENKVGAWCTGQVLGEGQFATVKAVCSGPGEILANTHFSSYDLAMKRINKDRVTDIRNMRRVNNEIRLLRELQHTSLARLVDVCHTETYLYIVQEKGGLDLFEHYRANPGPCNEAFVQSVFQQLCSAIAYLYANRVVHRDIKPENILIDEIGRVKLVDFGLSTYHSSEMTLEDFCGTPGFFAPEMLVEAKYSSEMLDVWSLGCVLLEMLLGHARFAEVWMPAYAYENLHDAKQFDNELGRCIGAVKAIFGEQICSRGQNGTLNSSASSSGTAKAVAKTSPSLPSSMHEESKLADAVSCTLVATSSEPSMSLKSASAADLLGKRDAASKHRSRVRRSSETYPHAITQHVNFRACVQALDEQQARSADCRDFLLAILVRSPHMRLKASQLMQHPFIDPMPDLVPGHQSLTTSEYCEKNNRGDHNRNVAESKTSKEIQTGETSPSNKNLQIHTEKALNDLARARLPPLSPASPQVEGMQELVKLGDDLFAYHSLSSWS